ncbi:hypothetical protein [Cereibacter sphaeroides]|jgi:hypothetical protein|nr:hypothetical protein [Cereibacter sphaeroides]
MSGVLLQGMVQWHGVVAQSGVLAERPLSRGCSGDGLDLGPAEG